MEELWFGRGYSHYSPAVNKCFPHDGRADYQYYQHEGFANCIIYSQDYNLV